MADLEHLHPTFRQRVVATGHAVNSGARATCCGPSSQQYLFDHQHQPGFNPANRPGSSWHEYGRGMVGGEWAMAVDFAGPPYPHGAPGLCFPIRDPSGGFDTSRGGEPWHAQPEEIRETRRTAGAEKRLPAPNEEDDLKEDERNWLNQAAADSRSTNEAVGRIEVAIRDQTNGVQQQLSAILDALRRRS